MPIEVIELDGGLGVTLKAKGVIHEKEFIEVIGDHLTGDDEKFKKYLYSIPDYSEVTDVRINNESIYRVTKFCKKAEFVNPDLVVALIAKKDLVYGLARMYQMLFNEKFWITSVFKDLKDAEEWIKEKVNEKSGIKGLTFS